ncbi:MAG: GNAT family N-acetyltransferase, partial [Chloroflexi bacterium]|nr:GNAT family N-acetyltransferase [Chloroflexota bacterium]
MFAALQGSKLYRVLLKKLVGWRVKYRAATEADVPALAHLLGYSSDDEKASSERLLRAQLDTLRPHGEILLGYMGSTLVATATIEHVSESPLLYPGWWVFSVVVHTAYRGAGIAETLMQAAIKHAQAHGADRLSLLVFNDNHP